ncbi:MAG: Mth938-like domain-containing protein, partial [Proteobacteria bacterium]|nr:Mth938-like domain-containing protein [Pseudomonadota bacterium]
KAFFMSGFSPVFLLFGLGAEVPDAVILARDFQKKFDLPCEVMTTGAAVRTYNVLALEGRQMAAALFAV